MTRKEEVIALLDAIIQSLVEYDISPGKRQNLEMMKRRYCELIPAFDEIWEKIPSREGRTIMVENIAHVYSNHTPDGLRSIRNSRADLKEKLADYVDAIHKAAELYRQIEDVAHEARLTPPPWFSDPLKLISHTASILHDENRKASYNSYVEPHLPRMPKKFNTVQHMPSVGEMLNALVICLNRAEFTEHDIDVSVAIDASRKSSPKDYVRVLKGLIHDLGDGTCPIPHGVQLSTPALLAINDVLGTELGEDSIRKA